MRRDQKICLWTIAATVSFFLSGYFVPTLDAQTVSGCLTKRGMIKRIDRPCKKNQQAVVLPLAETADQLREGIAELAGRNHEIPFHATIHPGEEAVLAGIGGLEFVAQVAGMVNAIAQTNNNAIAALEGQRYDVRLKLVNTGDTDAIYAGSGGTLRPQEAVELAQWEVDETLTVGHPEEDLVTAYNPDTGPHVQLEVSKMMLIADPEEDAVILVGAGRAIDREAFGVESRPIAAE